METGRVRGQLGSRENNTGRLSYIYFTPVGNTVGPLDENSDEERTNPHLGLTLAPTLGVWYAFRHVADVQSIWSFSL